MVNDKYDFILVMASVSVAVMMCAMIIFGFENRVLNDDNEAMNISLSVSEQAKDYWLNATYACWDREEVYKANLTMIATELNRTRAELVTLKHILSSYCDCDCDEQRIDDFLQGVDNQ